MEKKDLDSRTEGIRERVYFRFFEPGAKSVAVVGDFNRWDRSRHLLKRKSGGWWEMTMSLPPGSYEYKFLADGQWRMDPRNRCQCRNRYGTRNNVLIVSRRIKIQCAWCKKTMGTKAWQVADEKWFNVTHSVCPACAARIADEIRIACTRKEEARQYS